MILKLATGMTKQRKKLSSDLYSGDMYENLLNSKTEINKVDLPKLYFPDDSVLFLKPNNRPRTKKIAHESQKFA